MIRSLAILALLTGCVTPDQWSPETHARMMTRCRTMCGRNRVRAYDPSVSECLCVRQATED